MSTQVYTPLKHFERKDLRLFSYIDVMKNNHTENRNMFPSHKEFKDTVFQMKTKENPLV